MAELDIDRFWPGWQVTRELGEGGYGRVFQIERDTMGLVSKSALKVVQIPKSRSEIMAYASQGATAEDILAALEGRAQSMAREITTMQSLKTAPNVVAVEDFHVEVDASKPEWTFYIRMELLESLPAYIRRTGRLSAHEAVRMTIDVCRALECCQTVSIIHRDVKPDNVFREPFGSWKLGDFGIARQAGAKAATMTSIGTPTYEAPEVQRGLAYDATVDVYSTGVMLYQMVNGGRLPFMPEGAFDTETLAQALIKRLSADELPVPCEADPRLAAIVVRACRLNPSDRYRTAADFRAALEGWLAKADNPSSAVQPTVQPADAKAVGDTCPSLEEQLRVAFATKSATARGDLTCTASLQASGAKFKAAEPTPPASPAPGQPVGGSTIGVWDMFAPKAQEAADQPAPKPSSTPAQEPSPLVAQDVPVNCVRFVTDVVHHGERLECSANRGDTVVFDLAPECCAVALVRPHSDEAILLGGHDGLGDMNPDAERIGKCLENLKRFVDMYIGGTSLLVVAVPCTLSHWVRERIMEKVRGMGLSASPHDCRIVSRHAYAAMGLHCGDPSAILRGDELVCSVYVGDGELELGLLEMADGIVECLESGHMAYENDPAHGHSQYIVPLRKLVDQVKAQTIAAEREKLRRQGKPATEGVLRSRLSDRIGRVVLTGPHAGEQGARLAAEVVFDKPPVFRCSERHVVAGALVYAKVLEGMIPGLLFVDAISRPLYAVESGKWHPLCLRDTVIPCSAKVVLSDLKADASGHIAIRIAEEAVDAPDKGIVFYCHLLTGLVPGAVYDVMVSADVDTVGVVKTKAEYFGPKGAPAGPSASMGSSPNAGGNPDPRSVVAAAVKAVPRFGGQGDLITDFSASYQSKVRSSYGLAADEQPLLAYDGSVFKSAKFGFCMTDRQVVVLATNGDRLALSWPRFRQANIRRPAGHLIVDGKEYRLIKNSFESCYKEIYNLLADIQKRMNG